MNGINSVHGGLITPRRHINESCILYAYKICRLKLRRLNLMLYNSPEVIRRAVMMYLRYPLSLRQVEGLLFERGIGICHETV